MKTIINIVLGVFFLTSFVCAGAINSEVGGYKIIGEIGGSSTNFFGQPTVPDGTISGSVAKQTVTASGKSNQFANALAYLEKDGKVQNVMISDGAQIVLNSEGKAWWIKVKDCVTGKTCYQRIKVYQLGPNVPCSTTQVASTDVVSEVEVVMERAESAKVFEETKSVVVCEPDFSSECLDSGSMTVYTRNKNVTYVTAMSPYNNVVLMTDNSKIKIRKGSDEEVLDYSILPHQVTE